MHLSPRAEIIELTFVLYEKLCQICHKKLDKNLVIEFFAKFFVRNKNLLYIFLVVLCSVSMIVWFFLFDQFRLKLKMIIL